MNCGVSLARYDRVTRRAGLKPAPTSLFASARAALSGWCKKLFQCAVRVTAAGAVRRYYASFRHGLLRIRGEVMKRLLLGSMLAAVIAAPALAADMPAKAPVYKAPPPPVWSWTGFYVGVH